VQTLIQIDSFTRGALMKHALREESTNASTRGDIYSSDRTAQDGEDDVLERIFSAIPNGNKWCCEFGAWDGRRYSNTYQLIVERGWSAVLIEADAKKFKDLERTFLNNEKITLLNRFVEFSGNGLLDKLLSRTSIPIDFDLLSIDIDGNDFHIWKSIEHYHPKVVIIEYNQSIPNHIEFVQVADPTINQGSSLLSLTKLAASKGYQLVAVTATNGVYVRDEYFTLFNISDNSLSALNPAPPYVTDIFQLYDGTIILSGYKKMIWHDVRISERRIQIIPRWFRNFPDTMSKSRLFFFRVWRALHQIIY